MFPCDEDSLNHHPHRLPPHPFLRLNQSLWWGTAAPPYPRERADEEEDDAEGWGPKPELFVRWQKLSNTTIAISHSPSLSDYTDHYTAAAVCVGVCLCGEGFFAVVVEEGDMAMACSAPLQIHHSVKAADHYHYAYIREISWSSRARQELRTQTVL